MHCIRANKLKSAVDLIDRNRDIDAILLDRDGVIADNENDAWPGQVSFCEFMARVDGIPVIIASSQCSTDQFLDFFRAGARGTWDLVGLTLDSEKLQRMASDLVREVAGYEPRKLRKNYPLVKNSLVSKEFRKDRKGCKQLEFLEKVQNLTIGEYFPRIRHTTDLGNSVLASMDYFTGNDLAKAACENLIEDLSVDRPQQVDQAAILLNAVDDLLEVLTRVRMQTRKSVEPGGDHTFEARVKSVSDAVDSMIQEKLDDSWNDAFRRILVGNGFMIGTAQVPPIRKLMELLRHSTVIAKIQARDLCLVHGDLHFGNVFTWRLIGRTDLRFIDPGYIETSDWESSFLADHAYDIGKLLVSSLLHYDLIDKLEWTYDSPPLLDDNSYVVARSIIRGRRKVFSGGATAEAPRTRETVSLHQLLRFYAEANRRILTYCSRFRAEDASLLQRSLVYAGCHAVSAARSHLGNINKPGRPHVAFTLLIVGGLCLWNAFAPLINSGELKVSEDDC
jgi:hypothetical protein